MTKVIYRSGMRTIGGTIIEVINNDDRIIFDFGCVFDPTSSEEIIPNVTGVYNDDSKYNDTVLISHNHLDHIKALNLIHPNVDVLMHEDSIKLLDSLYSIGFDQIMGEKRSYKSIKVNEPIKINSFEVTALEVDHNIVGALAFLIKTDDLTLLYTGDLRIHGEKNQLTYDMIDYVNKFDIDLMITEGVSISFIEDDEVVVASNFVEEKEFTNGFLDLAMEVVDPSKQILFNPYIMTDEMLEQFVRLADKLGKQIVFTSEYAKIFKDLFPGVEIKVLEADKYGTGFEVVQFADITTEHVVQFDFATREAYKNLSPAQQLFQAGGEPLGEFDPKYKVLQDFCAENNIELISLSVSGHAFANNLKYIVDQIDPKILTPIHSFKPQLLLPLNGIQILPETDEVLVFANNELKEKYVDTNDISN